MELLHSYVNICFTLLKGTMTFCTGSVIFFTSFETPCRVLYAQPKHIPACRSVFFKLPIFRVKYMYLLKPSVSKLISNMKFLDEHNNLFCFVLFSPQIQPFSLPFFSLVHDFQPFSGIFWTF